MKKNIKVFLLILVLSFLTGCIWLMGPSEKIDAMLSKYVELDKSIVDELKSSIDKQNLNEEEKIRYQKIIEKEYSTMKYEIKKEKIDGDFATVNVNISVIDLFKAMREAENNLYENPSKFYTDGVYDSHKFIDYKLDLMENMKERKEYTIDFSLSRHDDIWYIEELSEDVLLKIHGIYNYSEK